MRVQTVSLIVDDQARAHDFYVDTLGFRVKHDIPVGGDARWLTVVSPEAPDGPEVLLEPSGHPAATTYRAALREDGIPLFQFVVDDVQAEYERLTDAGVEFTVPPMDAGTVMMAVFDDTVGNLIQIVAMK